MTGVVTKEQCNKNKERAFILNSFVGYTSRRERTDDLFKMKSGDVCQRIKNGVCQPYPQKY